MPIPELKVEYPVSVTANSVRSLVFCLYLQCKISLKQEDVRETEEIKESMRVEKKEAHRVETWHQCTDSAVEVRHRAQAACHKNSECVFEKIVKLKFKGLVWTRNKVKIQRCIATQSHKINNLRSHSLVGSIFT